MVVSIRQIHFDSHRAGLSIQRVHHTGDGSFKRAFRIRFRAHLGLLPDLNQRHVLFHDFDQRADGIDFVQIEMPRDMVELLPVEPLTNAPASRLRSAM